MTDAVSDRAAWLLELRRENEVQEAGLAPVFDERWGEIRDEHRGFVERLCSMLPPDGKVLDAACGTGKYFGVVLGTGRSVLGVDHTSAYLEVAATKFPDVPTERHDLQDLPFEDGFEGVICVDAMEFVPPEDWPVVLERFRRALRRPGWLYLTVELVEPDAIRAANAEARAAGLPVVDGEVIWRDADDPDGYYHHYPSIEQVRAWMREAGFTVRDDVEGTWEDGYAYHHVLARTSEG